MIQAMRQHALPARKLAAIMPARRSPEFIHDEGGPASHSANEGWFADIVGYTALIGKDTDKAQ